LVVEGRNMQRFAKAPALTTSALPAVAQAQVPDTTVYGVADHDAYTPVDRKVKRGEPIDLAAWDVTIIEEDGLSD
jgi:beta-galactosidase